MVISAPRRGPAAEPPRDNPGALNAMHARPATDRERSGFFPPFSWASSSFDIGNRDDEPRENHRRHAMITSSSVGWVLMAAFAKFTPRWRIGAHRQSSAARRRLARSVTMTAAGTRCQSEDQRHDGRADSETFGISSMVDPRVGRTRKNQRELDEHGHRDGITTIAPITNIGVATRKGRKALRSFL